MTDIDPLLNSAAVCKALGIGSRKALRQRISKGQAPAPDATICDRDYWLTSRIKAAIEAAIAAHPAVPITVRQASSAKLVRARREKRVAAAIEATQEAA